MRAPIWFARAVDRRSLSTKTHKHRASIPVLSALIGVHWGLISTLSAAPPQWKIQYLYDHADSNFAIEDLECPTTQHCVAAGLIDDKKGHEQGSVVVTSDGGIHWSQYEVKEHPVSLFFLNEGQGWMVTDKGLWSTTEGGRTWSKVDSSKGILQAWFLDANHGYIVGMKGLAQETFDGGKKWAKLEAAEKASDANSLNYDIISFQGAHGIIIGATETLAQGVADPKGVPANNKVTVLETLDGGKQWKAGAIPLDGELAQLRLSRQGFVVSLVLYSNPNFPVASAVYRTPLGTPDGKLIFGERDRAASDVALLPDGSAVLVAVEPPGASTQVPIPGKLKILKSENMKVWQEMDVDYRAVAQRAIIAAPDAQHMWVATDTGAILAFEAATP